MSCRAVQPHPTKCDINSRRLCTPVFSKIALRWSCTVYEEMSERARHLRGREAATREAYQLTLACGQPVDFAEQVKDFIGRGGADGDRDARRLVSFESSAFNHAPPARAGADAHVWRQSMRQVGRREDAGADLEHPGRQHVAAGQIRQPVGD